MSTADIVQAQGDAHREFVTVLWCRHDRAPRSTIVKYQRTTANRYRMARALAALERAEASWVPMNA